MLLFSRIVAESQQTSPCLTIHTVMPLNEESRHFSCERETIVERQVHCQSSD